MAGKIIFVVLLSIFVGYTFGQMDVPPETEPPPTSIPPNPPPTTTITTNPPNTFKCEKLGLQCDKNNKIIFCFTISGSGEVIKDCNQNNQICTGTGKDTTCADRTKLDMICTGKGEFPDPSNCSRTYICDKENKAPSQVCFCPGGSYVYPATGLFCVSDECPRESINCEEGKFDYFKLKGTNTDTSFCYYCHNETLISIYKDCEPVSRTMPMRLTMAEGKTCFPFAYGHTSPKPPEASDDTTAAPTDTTAVPSNTAAPTDTTAAPSNTTAAPTNPTTSKPECKKEGNIFPSECDCYYYFCLKDLTSKRYRCPEGLRFVKSINMCYYGECDPSKCDPSKSSI